MTETGADAEEAALAYFRNQGLKLIARNLRCQFGEIDLVMQDAKTLVFAEVRFRRNADFAGAAESITGRKKARIVSAASLYLARLAGLPPCRFDAPLLTANAPTQGIKDAFSE